MQLMTHVLKLYSMFSPSTQAILLMISKIQIYILHVLRSYFFDKSMMLYILFLKPQLSVKLFIVSPHILGPHVLTFYYLSFGQDSDDNQLFG